MCMSLRCAARRAGMRGGAPASQGCWPGGWLGAAVRSVRSVRSDCPRHKLWRPARRDWAHGDCGVRAGAAGGRGVDAAPCFASSPYLWARLPGRARQFNLPTMYIQMSLQASRVLCLVLYPLWSLPTCLPKHPLLCYWMMLPSRRCTRQALYCQMSLQQAYQC